MDYVRNGSFITIYIYLLQCLIQVLFSVDIVK